MTGLALSLALAIQAGTFDASAAWDGTPAREAAIRRAVAEQLLDPRSALFRDVEVRRPTGQADAPAVVCGKIQGSNGFGGMGQPSLWFYTDRATVLPAPTAGGERADQMRSLGQQMWRTLCEERTEPVQPLQWDDEATQP